MNICLIPARGGSKRIPRKNIKIFRGKPMIKWSIEAAIESQCFDKIYVSTDDKEIAKIALESGAEVPFIRPKYISDDFSTTQQVISHAINWLESNKITITCVCCIYATAPFIQTNDIKKAMSIYKNIDTKSFVYTATTFEFPIQRAIKINEKGYSEMFYPENYNKRSQDLEEAFHDAGQFYIGCKNAWIKNYNFFDNGKPLILPRWRVQDIDNEEDWIRAEKLHKIVFD